MFPYYLLKESLGKSWYNEYQRYSKIVYVNTIYKLLTTLLISIAFSYHTITNNSLNYITINILRPNVICKRKN